MRRVLIFMMALAFLTCGLFVQTGGAQEDSASSRPKKMTMVFTKTKNEYYGKWMFLVFTEAFRRIGMELVFEACPPKRCSYWADEGKVDGELGRIRGYDQGHPNLVRVEEPVTTISWVAYATDPSIKVSGWASLKGTKYTVEHRRGIEGAESHLSEFVEDERLSFVGNIQSGLRKLVAGRTDIYVDIEESVEPYLSDAEFGESRILKAGIMEEETLHAFLHRKNKAYAAELSLVLMQMKREGLMEAYTNLVQREVGVPPTSNTMLNGTFRDMNGGVPSHWRFSGPKGSLDLDTAIFNEGKHSIRIRLERGAGETARLEQDIDVEAGKRYDIGGKIKVHLEEGRATIQVTFLDRDRKEIMTYELPSLTNDNDWTYQNMWVKSPNGADAARVECIVDGRGTAWFDDIHFTKKIRGGY